MIGYFRTFFHVHHGRLCNCGKTINRRSEFHFWRLVGHVLRWEFYTKPRFFSPVLRAFRKMRTGDPRAS